MKYDLTPDIRARNDLLAELRALLDRTVTPRFFWQRSVPMSEQIELVRVVAEHRSGLILAVERAYPTLRGKGYTVSGAGIEADEEETPASSERP
jgi:hypothetical protein